MNQIATIGHNNPPIDMPDLTPPGIGAKYGNEKFRPDRIWDFANRLETVPAKNFDMSAWTSENSDCGTAACVAGWCQDFYQTDHQPGTSYFSQLYMGLEDNQAGALFYGKNWRPGRGPSNPTSRPELPNGTLFSAICEARPDHAAEVLRQMADTYVDFWYDPEHLKRFYPG